MNRRPSIIRGPTSPPLLEWTFNDLLDERVRQHPQNTALICPQQSIRLTYAELQAQSRQVAVALHGLGVSRGDRVGILLGNRAEYVVIFLACAKLGAYATLFNYAYTQAELENALRSTDPKVLFTTLRTSRYAYRDMLERIRQRRPSLRRIIVLDDVSSPCALKLPSDEAFTSYNDLIARAGNSDIDIANLEKAVQPHDILNLQFTSGSTGLPKAAALTHRGMLNSARYIGLQMGVNDRDKIVIPVPLFHAFGLIMGVCNTFLHGASTILPSEYWDVTATLLSIPSHRATGLYGVTTMFVDQLSHPTFPTTDRSSLQFGLMAGSAMPEELLNRVMQQFPIARLFTNWGMTELSSVATMTTAADPVEKKMRTAGKLLPHFNAKIVEPDTGRVLPWGQRGEIVVEGFGVMDSYFGNEEQTRRAIKVHAEDALPGGLRARDEKGEVRRWMHTGDEAYLDEEGYFVITGRIKDLIIRGGENISPLEIEARLYEHPAVQQAVVFGVRSERFGEEVAAIVELKVGDSVQARPTEEQLKAWVRGALARFKVPVQIWWLGDKELGIPSEWPKTANGKLRRIDVKNIGEGLLQRQPAKLRPSL